jgi:O-antigen ligase
MGRTVPRHSDVRRTTKAPEPSAMRWLTQFAFVLTLVLVIARAMMIETVRAELTVVTGSTAEPAVPGPATSLVLDLLCCIPALCVLGRRTFDRTFTLRFTWSHLLMGLLALWTVLSIIWASDQFAAAVSATNWATALVLLWSTSQLVRSWLRLRIVAGVVFGLLLVLVAEGYWYRFLDLPDFQRMWHEQQDQLLRQRGIEPGSREAVQMAKNIESGEVRGFTVSRNTFAAELVLLGIITAGVAIQRRADGDEWVFVMPLLAALLLAIVLLYLYVRSKTAYLTPVMAAVLLVAVWRWRDLLARRAKSAYWTGVGGFFLLVAAVVGHGLKHGTLVHSSLTFRWQYWVGAARLFTHHVLLGVGWANFGPRYLAFRLPVAPEEPKDPHNFLVRAFVELGVIGGILMLVWMLRLWWEWTRSVTPVEERDRSTGEAYGWRMLIRLIGTVTVGGIVVNAFASLDWNQSSAWVILELFRRGMFLLLLVGGMAIVCIQRRESVQLDQRPAPWLLYALLIGLGLFLLHNLIDFSMFEVGPMFLFALLAGSALGVRTPARAPSPSGGWAAGAGLIGGVIGCFVVAGAFVAPVVSAESLAAEADDAVRHGNAVAASQKLWDAFHKVPFNGDYAFRAAAALQLAQGNPLTIRQMLEAATAADPSSGKYWLGRAVFESDFAGTASDYRRAIDLDPNNVSLRIEFADLLVKNGKRIEAREQYVRALELNNQLAPDEMKRLPSTRIEETQKKIAALPAK